MKGTILLVDDEPAVLDGLTRALRDEPYEILCAQSAEDAQRLMKAQPVHVVVSDHLMPGMKGLEFLKWVHQQFPETIRVILTGQVDLALAQRAITEGTIFRFFTKPCNTFDLIITIHQGLYLQGLEQTNQGLSEAIRTPVSSFGLVQESSTGKMLAEHVRKLANLDATVLITGESGTGKTTLARMIHHASPRASHPFVSVSCAALPRDLIEAELFGHERGAFTGAVATRPGRVELADQGTLFLDEIGDMPLELQPKLLTFLDDHLVRRLGGNTVRKVDVRVIAATNQDLPSLCQHKLFREDLYFRLDVLSLRMPPLRERREDLPVLIQNILARMSHQHGGDPITLTAEAREALLHYEWPGNLRELENLLERAAALCVQGRIRGEDVLFKGQHVRSTSIDTAPSKAPQPHGSVIRTLAEAERQAIREALQLCQGNKAAAARSLGISEKTIYNKMKRLELSA